MLGFNVPAALGIGQFGLPVFAFVEKANSGVGTVAMGPTEQSPERRESPRRQNIRPGGRHRFDPTNNDFRLFNQGHTASRLAEKRGFPRVRFDQDDVQLRPQRCQNQPWKASTRTEIRYFFCRRRQMWNDLR
jgi:hypothetical protein